VRVLGDTADVLREAGIEPLATGPASLEGAPI
jgi:hypothetical protein